MPTEEPAQARVLSQAQAPTLELELEQVQVRNERAQVQKQKHVHVQDQVQKQWGTRSEQGLERKPGHTARTFSETIAVFDRTPPGIVCPHFAELRWAFGCPYSCQWCFPVGTSLGRKQFRAYPAEVVLTLLQPRKSSSSYQVRQKRGRAINGGKQAPSNRDTNAYRLKMNRY